MVGLIAIIVSFVGFLVFLGFASYIEGDCAPVALDPDAGPKKLYASSVGLPWARPFVNQ